MCSNVKMLPMSTYIGNLIFKLIRIGTFEFHLNRTISFQFEIRQIPSKVKCFLKFGVGNPFSGVISSA